MKKQFLILFAFISVLALSQVPQRFNKVIVTGDIVSPKFIKTGSNADSVLLGNGSARAISTIKTDTINLSNRINAKATGNGTANGTNTGDETLTSIKTKLGAATSVSDGYLKYQDFVRFDGKQPAGSYLTSFTETDPTIYSWAKASSKPTYTYSEVGAASSSTVSNATHTGDATGSTVLTLATVNSNIGTFNNITINSKGLATAGSNVSYEPSFSKNTGFNKPFGNTTGTVLEGRTFGTAANSSVGDFQPTITGLTTNYIPKWNGSGFVNSLISDDGTNIGIGTNNPSSKFQVFGISSLPSTSGTVQNAILRISSGNGSNVQTSTLDIGSYNSTGASWLQSTDRIDLSAKCPLLLNPNGGNIGIGFTTDQGYKLAVNGGVSASSFYGSGSNMTGVQLPITLTTNGTSGAATLTGTTLNIPNYTIAPSSGNYAQSITLLSGLASSASTVAMYTKNGNNYHVGLSGVLTTNAAGTCSFRIQLPSSVTGSNAVVIPHIFGLSGSYVAHSYASSFGSTNVVDISFISTSVSGSSFNYNVMIDYY